MIPTTCDGPKGAVKPKSLAIVSAAVAINKAVHPRGLCEAKRLRTATSPAMKPATITPPLPSPAMSRIYGHRPIATMPTYPAWSSDSDRQLPAADPGAPRAASNVWQHDEMVAEHVRVLQVGREMPGQMLAHSANRTHKAVGGPAAPDRLRQVGHDRLPYALGHLRMDGSVGNDLGAAFANRDVDQHPRPADRGVEILRQELLHGAPVHPSVLEGLGNQRQAYRARHEEDDEPDKHHKLQQVDALDRPPRKEHEGPRHSQSGERGPEERAVQIAGTLR